MTAEQLSLPQIDPYLPSQSVFALPYVKRVWVNRSLRMDQIEWVGFDMDYTLAIYKQAEIDRLSIDATVKKLLGRGYPDALAGVPYHYEFPIRGLLIDKRYGHMLKMDRYKYVGKAYHGTRELSREERRGLYHSRKVRPLAPRYHWIDTLYALPEAALYAGAVDLLDKLGQPVDYAQLFQDIRECIDEAHRDGAIVDVIQRDLPRFVEKDRDLGPTLHKLRSAGKKLFLLTNSRWGYTDAMMTFLLDGMMPEYPTWRNYFDVVVTAATKPAFFQEHRPFMERVGGESIPASRLERGKIYEGGNLRDFERMIGSGGDSVLYIGDHIYGDILRSKKESAWRTAMIVQEMEAEAVAMESTREEVARLDNMARRRDRLEDELRFRQARLKGLTRALEDKGVLVGIGNGNGHGNGSSGSGGGGSASGNGGSSGGGSASRNGSGHGNGSAIGSGVGGSSVGGSNGGGSGERGGHAHEHGHAREHRHGHDQGQVQVLGHAHAGREMVVEAMAPPEEDPVAVASPSRRVHEGEEQADALARANGEGMVAAATAASLAAMPLDVNAETVTALEAERQREKRAIERIRVALRDLDEESRRLARRVDHTFHPYWGSIFKLGVELSSFGDQVENYACLYCARVSNFLWYSPLHYFRSPRDFMPHELP